MNRSIVISGLFALAANMGALAQPVQTWGRYMDLTVNTTATGGGANVSSGVTNFPLLVRLDSVNATAVLAQALAGGADIRFADSVGNKIPHEIESWGATRADIWVLVPSIAGNASTKIRLYWGKAGAANESNGANVFSTSNGFEAVFHMKEAPGDTIRDATANGYKGVPVVGTTAGSTAPTSIAGPIGIAKAFGGNVDNTAAGAQTGGAYRLETAAGGNTHNSFNYTGMNAEFTISVWTNFSAYPLDFPRRRGLITKADHGTNQLDNNDPLTQWFLRPNITARVMHFQRVAAVGYGTAPYSIVENGGLAGVLNTWNYVSFAANGTVVDENRFRLYNPTASTFRTLADEDGVHQDVDVFIGGFASNSGVGTPKSGGTHFLNGMADEVRISNVARSAAWVDLEYATQRPGATAVTYGTAQNNDTSKVVVYPVRSASFVVGQAITSVTPFVKAGNTVTAWAIAPALSAGLTFSTTTGVISGTPTAVSASAAYVVTATVGGNPHRDTLTIAVTAGTPPGQPTGVTAVRGNAQVTVGWTAPASTGSFPISSYTARATQDTTKTCTWTTGPLTCTVTALTNGTSYSFVVRANSSAGSSAFSTASASVIPATVPGAPTGVTAMQQPGIATVTVLWTAPTSTGGLAITGYTARATQDTTKFCTWFTGPLSCNVTGLTNGSSYTFVVRATNAVGTGNFSAPSSSMTVGILPGSFAIHVTGSSRPFAFTLTPEAAASTEALTMSIMDMQGRTVWSRTVNPAKDGTREMSWNGVSSKGRAVSAGVYMVRVATVNGGNTADFIRPAVSVK